MRARVNMSTISGPYEVSGKVLLLPITGRGKSDIKFGKYFFDEVIVRHYNWF